MNLAEVFLVAVGLSMDAFAVSVTSGFTLKKLNRSNAFAIAFSFGLFQAIMPVIGWFAGQSLREYIKEIDHWIAFGLLAFIGVKMILESGKMKKDEEKNIGMMSIKTLFLLSLATSIDALAVGLSMSFLDVSIMTPALVIGLVTFLISYLGVCIGTRFGHIFESRLELAGGLILISIGIKILIEHLTIAS